MSTIACEVILLNSSLSCFKHKVMLEFYFGRLAVCPLVFTFVSFTKRKWKLIETSVFCGMTYDSLLSMYLEMFTILQASLKSKSFSKALQANSVMHDYCMCPLDRIC